MAIRQLDANLICLEYKWIEIGSVFVLPTFRPFPPHFPAKTWTQSAQQVFLFIFLLLDPNQCIARGEHIVE